MYKRAIEKNINKYLSNADKKVLFVWGPRRSGKTTILRKIAKEYGVRLYNFDLVSDREKFAPRREVLAKIVKENKIILIDEIQSYPESTVMVKILHDEYGVKVIATGSSELRQKSKDFDSLAGRYRELHCLPLSTSEIVVNRAPRADEEQNMSREIATQLQIYGAYPEIYTNEKLSEKSRIDLLQNILDTHILKDVVNIYELKNEKLAKDILLKIALQIGSEVSVREIANSLGAYASTVANYIEIFIKNYVLIPLPSFGVNARRAVSKNRKLYFYDLGIRNMLVRDFRELELRPDMGGVFENFVIAEIEKVRRLTNSKVNLYFYREYGGKEVDLVIEDYKKNYMVVEIKVNKGKIRKIFPKKHRQIMITMENYQEGIRKVLE